MSLRFEMQTVLLGATLAAMMMTPGCLTLEQRWERFDAERRQEIGVKTKEFYLSEWGRPAKRAKSDDGGDVGVLRVWRGTGLEKDVDLHARWSPEGLSSGLLA